MTRPRCVITLGDIKLLVASSATGNIKCSSNRMNINDGVKRRRWGTERIDPQDYAIHLAYAHGRETRIFSIARDSIRVALK